MLDGIAGLAGEGFVVKNLSKAVWKTDFEAYKEQVANLNGYLQLLSWHLVLLRTKAV